MELSHASVKLQGYFLYLNIILIKNITVEQGDRNIVHTFVNRNVKKCVGDFPVPLFHRVKKLFPLFIDFLTLPDEVLDSLLGDFITEGVGRVLASVAGDDDIASIKKLIEDENIEEYVRGQALRSLVILVLHDQLDRSATLTYFQTLLHKKWKVANSYVMAEIVCCCKELYPDVIYEDIKRAYNHNLVDEWVINLTDINRTIQIGKESMLKRARNNPHFQKIDDTITELEGWACFYKDKEKNTIMNDNKILNTLLSSNQTIVNEVKIGRNDPCPCGSGKKYKKCCG